jgi:PAS domain S-box-containing protein
MSIIRVVYAAGDAAEHANVSALKDENIELTFPESLAEVEALVGASKVDVIVTDYFFGAGGFADWLSLWPLPAVLLVDPGEDAKRTENTLRDESSVFLIRDTGGEWLRYLPAQIRKARNLRESISRHNTFLSLTERQYMNLLQAIPDIVYILDGNGCFLYLNDAVRSLGWEPTKLIGHHFSEIIHPADVPSVSREVVLERFEGTVTGPERAPKLFDERRSGQRMTRNLEVRLVRHTDTDGWLIGSVNAYGEVNSSGMELPEHEVLRMGTVGIIRDITARKEHQKKLENDLAAKEILLKEIHHRVKNNLQVVSSLLNLQENAVDDERVRGVFLECQTQIQSMAMVHEQLYRSMDLEGVEMEPYLSRLAEYLSGIYEAAYHGVGYEVQAQGVRLDLDTAIPIAIVTNELISNSFKHGYPGGGPGKVFIGIRDLGDAWELEVSDNGIGFAASKARVLGASGEDKRSSISSTGLGTELIAALTAQIKGKESHEDSGGARTRIQFPKSAQAPVSS